MRLEKIKAGADLLPRTSITGPGYEIISLLPFTFSQVNFGESFLERWAALSLFPSEFVASGGGGGQDKKVQRSLSGLKG